METPTQKERLSLPEWQDKISLNRTGYNFEEFKERCLIAGYTTNEMNERKDIVYLALQAFHQQEMKAKEEEIERLNGLLCKEALSEDSIEEGLKTKYNITKTDGSPVNPNAEYFVLRLDEFQSDIFHRMACLKGLRAYADSIEPFIPSLAKDLREKYPIIN